MKRSILLALALASAVAAPVALTACDRQGSASIAATDAGASAPGMSASLVASNGGGTAGGMDASAGAPMDSISSASAVAGSDGASAAAAQARDAMQVAASSRFPARARAGEPSRQDALPPR